MENLYMYMVVIIYSIFMIYVGFKVALLRWNYKENSQKLENYETLNNQLTETNQKYVELVEKINASGKHNKEWYISQLRNLSYYLKEKHSDDFLDRQLYDIFNNPEEQEIDIPGQKKQHDINNILDKISKSGIESLTEEELKFLNNNNNNNNKGDEDKK